jgi:hypothetical protein
MELYERIEQILEQLRPAFGREATFNWFVLLLWGVLLNTQARAVTSYLNALGLSEGYYHQALHWFDSRAFWMDDLCYRWGRWLRDHQCCHRLNGQRVYLGDGIKVGKEGRKMPGVKRLHQESEDVNKPEWIRGHSFSALAILLGAGQAVFAVPLIFKLSSIVVSRLRLAQTQEQISEAEDVQALAQFFTATMQRMGAIAHTNPVPVMI